MIFKELPLLGAYLIDLEKKEDARGFFARSFCDEEFLKLGLNIKWAQINTSFTKSAGTLRGLHLQHPPHTEVKVIRCIRGSIWDVIVDLRALSKTYGYWFGVELNQDNRSMIYVPNGFAHGFISLEDESEIMYLVSHPYSQKHEVGLIWNDKDVGIKWPIKPTLISEKDKINLPLTKLKKVGIEFN